MSGGSMQNSTPAMTTSRPTQPWPSLGAAYYGLAVIILATMLNFFDANLFTLMAQTIKVDFKLTDEELGFLVGPANVIFYVLVGIPMARLVDTYPRKIVLACGIAAIGGITALGCTIGQGVTGVSTLSVGSVIALVSIVAGGRLGLWWIVERGRASAPSFGAAIPATASKADLNRVSCIEP